MPAHHEVECETVTEDDQERNVATDHFRTATDFSESRRPGLVCTEELLTALLLPTQPSVKQERGGRRRVGRVGRGSGDNCATLSV